MAYIVMALDLLVKDEVVYCRVPPADRALVDQQLDVTIATQRLVSVFTKANR